MTLVEVAHGAAFWVLAGEFELVFANRVAFVKSFKRFYRAGICVPAGFTLRSVVGAPL